MVRHHRLKVEKGHGELLVIAGTVHLRSDDGLLRLAAGTFPGLQEQTVL
jgi:hypothetical protein